MSPLVQVISSRVDPDTWLEFAVGIAMVTYGLVLDGATISVWTGPLLVAAVVNGAALYFAIHLVAQSLAFWVTESSIFSFLIWRLDEYTKVPMSYFPAWALAAFSTVLPLAFVAYYPATIILDLDPAWWAWLTPVATAASLAISLLVWRRGLRRYASTGS